MILEMEVDGRTFNWISNDRHVFIALQQYDSVKTTSHGIQDLVSLSLRIFLFVWSLW